MSDDEYEGDPEYEELVRSNTAAARVLTDRLERWTRLQSVDGGLTVHCPVSQLGAVVRQRVSEQQAEGLGGVEAGDHVVVVAAAGYHVLVARFGPAKEAAAEAHVAEFLALRGLDREGAP